MIAVRGKLIFPAKHPQKGTELWVLDNGATGWRQGYGCGDATGPELRLTDPKLGELVTISTHELQPTDLGLLFAGIPVKPYQFFLSPSPLCQLHIAIPAVILVDSWVQSGTAPRVLTLTVPNNNNLLGLIVGLQTVVGSTNNAAGFDLSNSDGGLLGNR